MLNPDLRRAPARRSIRATLIGGALAVAMAAAALAGEITVKGEDLEGVVAGITADGVQFETIYGAGRIVIPFADIEAIESEKRFVILYGESSEVRGRLLGVTATHVLIGDDPADAVQIATGDIFRSFGEQEYDDSAYDALKSRYRYWNANFDLGFAATQATTDTGSVNLGFGMERRKAPTRVVLRGFWRFATQKEKGEPKNTIENDVRALLRGEYDLTDRWFAFASVTGEYDEIQSLSLRTVPKGGLGYRIWQSEKGFLSADLGFSYVYQRFFGGATDDYPALSIGSEAEYALPFGSKLTAQGEYLPSVNSFKENYLLRGSAAWTLPLLEWLGFKLTLFDEYNNRPAEGTKKNKLTVTAGLSLLF